MIALIIATVFIGIVLVLLGASILYNNDEWFRRFFGLVVNLLGVASLVVSGLLVVNGTQNHAAMLRDYGNSEIFSEHKRLIQADGFNLNVVYEVNGARYRCKAYTNTSGKWDIPKVCQKIED